MDLQYPNKQLTTPLTATIDRSDPTILTILIDKVPGNLDDSLTQHRRKTALMHAALYARNPEILHVLIKKGADPNKIDVNGWNCLFYAVVGKRLENIVALLEYELPIDSKDHEGRTLLMTSVYLSNFETFKFLLDQGADVEILDNNGLNALHLAILYKKRDFVLELTKRNSNMHVSTLVTNTPAYRLRDELMYDVLPVRRKFCYEE